MTCHQTGDNPLPKPLLANFSDVLWYSELTNNMDWTKKGSKQAKFITTALCRASTEGSQME